MLVLVADDNPDNRQLLYDIIMTIGHESVGAADGEEAIRITRERLPDLLILDVNMPGINGFEVVNQIKADPKTAHIPVLMLTALNTDDHRVQGLVLGADDYLTKPFNPRELIERIKTRLRQKEQTDALQKQKAMILATFGRFVAPAVVEQLLQAPEQVALGGTLQEVTVLFADLEGFTSISEHTAPDKLLAVLNRYHTLMVGIVRENGGTVDKFMGDGLMALYNTPLAQADHALRAVRTALSIREALVAFYEQLEADFRCAVNFGIHTGMAVVGNVGAPELMNFTAIGDTVNLAFRLQELSSKGCILVSEETHRRVQDQVGSKSNGSTSVRGRATPVTTYEITA
jgi:adenylate cyclase